MGGSKPGAVFRSFVGPARALSVVLCLVGTVFVLGWLARAAYCAFATGIFTLFDYGVYTNAIWNSGFGRPFLCLVDDSYLKTHLSFSLALLGPILRLWRHPFALWMLQWSFFVCGAWLVWLTGHRQKQKAYVTAAVVLFFVGYHYSQAAVLSEFRGVSFYLFLVPWLYYCLGFRKHFVWMPLLLTLGLREDAFVVVFPMLLYFAIRDRWLLGYVYAVLALAYGLFALFELYPLINGASLMSRRGAEIAANPLTASLTAEGLRARALPLLWLLLPVLPFFFLPGKPWIPLLVFPLPCLIQAMGSTFEPQYTLAFHYPAPVFACLIPAMLEALFWARTTEADTATDAHKELTRWPAPAIPAYLMVLTVVSHLLYGFVPGGGNREKFSHFYVHPKLHGIRAIEAARHLPRTGTVICSWQLAGFCANRENLMVWRKYDRKRHRYDAIFTNVRPIRPGDGDECLDVLRQRRFGVTYFDGDFLILERGASPSRNAAMLDAFDRADRTVRFANMHKHDVKGLRTASAKDGRMVRHWAGNGKRAPVTLGFGISVPLEAGAHTAVFRFKAATPARSVRGSWGQLSLHDFRTGATLIEVEIAPVDTGDEFRTQTVRFKLAAAAEVEPRATGGDAELWFDRVVLTDDPEDGERE